MTTYQSGGQEAAHGGMGAGHLCRRRLRTVSVLASGLLALSPQMARADGDTSFHWFSAPYGYAPPGQVRGAGEDRPKTPWDVWGYQRGKAGGWSADSRWAEDYSFLGQPQAAGAKKPRKPDFFDPAKFVPLNTAKDIFLTFSGETRLKDYLEIDPYLGHSRPTDQTHNILRNLYGVDLHAGKSLRAYFEMINAEDIRNNGTKVGGNQRSLLDFQQAFVEGKAQVAGAQSGVMVGRQDYADGPNSLIDIGNAPNVHKDWDGVRAYAIWPRFRFDLFNFHGVNLISNSFFRDNMNVTTHLDGAYGSFALPSFRFLGRKSQLFLDGIYWDYSTNPSSVTVATATNPAATQSGSGHREIYGARFWGNAGPVALDYSFLYQTGNQQIASAHISRPVRAFAISTYTGYSLSKLRFQPTPGIQVNYYSGGNVRKTTGSIGTYTAPLSGPSYFALDKYILQQNIFDIAPEVRATITPSVRFYLQLPIMWRASVNDDLYGDGYVYPTKLGHGRYVGVMPLAQVSWSITRHLTLSEIVTGFIQSRMMHAAGNSNAFQLLSNLDFKF